MNQGARDEGTSRMLATATLRIGGMHCAACSGTIEAALRRVPGVVAAEVSAAAQCATVRWDASQSRAEALAAAVAAAGYEAVPETAAAARAARRAEGRRALWRLFVAAFCAMQVMMLASPAYFSAPGDLAADQKKLLDAASWMLSLPVLLFSAAPIFRGAWRALATRRLGMDVPVALGIGAAFAASSAAAFDPGGLFGHEVYFDSLTMFVSFLAGARFLEMQARHRAEMRLEEATGRLPDVVLRIQADGACEAVAATDLRRGDRVRVPAGQAFAADGVLLEGRTQSDEALLSGESRPIDKGPGDTVAAGSLNLGAPVEMRVEQVGADTRYEAIVALMRTARSQRPALLASADRWAGPFLWAVLGLALAAGLAWAAIDLGRAVWVVVAVLVVTCPCALSLAAPSALLTAAGTMARGGLLLRRLDAIEGLATIGTLFVDKTGTLTDGRLTLGATHVRSPMPAAEARAVAASLAVWSSHPLALALRASAAAPAVWYDCRETAGCGVEARDASGRHWRLGAPGWVEAGLVAGASRAALGCDGKVIALFEFEEQLRPGTLAALDALRADGVRVALISGDAPERVAGLASGLRIDEAVGGLTPEGKLAALRAAQGRGERVAMIGDGINDAPVLAQADLSIAMGEGAAIARAEADGVLVADRLQAIVEARRLARRAMRVVRQNLAWAAAYNAACVPLALAGLLPAWAAGLGMAASSLVVVGNALRLAR